jgi:hypothetical protein
MGRSVTQQGRVGEGRMSSGSLPGKLPWIHNQIVTAEQGSWENGMGKPLRLWNGDETDRGRCFYEKPKRCE